MPEPEYLAHEFSMLVKEIMALPQWELALIKEDLLKDIDPIVARCARKVVEDAA